MNADQIRDGSFGPEALKVMGKAFDEAWSSIAGNFCDDPRVVEAGRLKLADALLSVSSDASRDAQILVAAALQRLARSYRA